MRWGCAAAIVAVAVPMIGGPAPARADEPVFGVVSQQRSLTDADMARMSEGHVGMLRLTLNWADIDSGPVAGYDWSKFDEVVGAAARQGISVLPVVYSVPAWVSRFVEDCEGDDCSRTVPHTATGLAVWRTFLANAARRYGPDGIFWAGHPEIQKRPLRVWQIWNEENDPGFFKPRPDVDRYADLFGAAAEAIHGQDAGAEVILGGMCCYPLHGEDGGIQLTDYLRRLYGHPDVAGTIDGVAIHPYGQRMKGVEHQVETAAAVVRQVAPDPQTPLWITETGWSSGRGPHPLARGPRGQAHKLREAFGYFAREGDRLGIRAVLWYAWRDVPKSYKTCKWCPLSGLFPVASLDRPKPAWNAFVSFTGGS
jgi:hypothetical protein